MISGIRCDFYRLQNTSVVFLYFCCESWSVLWSKYTKYVIMGARVIILLGVILIKFLLIISRIQNKLAGRWSQQFAPVVSSRVKCAWFGCRGIITGLVFSKIQGLHLSVVLVINWALFFSFWKVSRRLSLGLKCWPRIPRLSLNTSKTESDPDNVYPRN